MFSKNLIYWLLILLLAFEFVHLRLIQVFLTIFIIFYSIKS